MSKDINKWRLPTIEELSTLVDHTKHNPSSTDQEVKPYYYWSSTTYNYDRSYAWGVGFYSGEVNGRYKTTTYHVRCVMNTSKGLEWSKTADKQMTWDEAIEYANNMNKERT